MRTPTKQEAEAFARLGENPDFKSLLTFYRDECIEVFTNPSSTNDELIEAHRRHALTDELQGRIKAYAKRR